MAVILATQEARIRRIAVRSPPLGKKKNPSQNMADGVAQGVGPEFKPQYCRKKRRRRRRKRKELKNKINNYSGRPLRASYINQRWTLAEGESHQVVWLVTKTHVET
jgi:hypothetical protein